MVEEFLSSYDLLISPSEQLIEQLNNCQLCNNEGDNAEVENKFIKGENVNIEDIRKLANHLQKDPNGVPHLHELLRDCQIILPKPPIPARNPELEARIQVLKGKQQEKEYVQMTKGVDASYKYKYANEFRQEVKTLRSHMAASVNFVITVGACFLFGYKGVEYALPSPNLAGQVIVGIIAGSVGALADLYFLAKQLDAAP